MEGGGGLRGLGGWKREGERATLPGHIKFIRFLASTPPSGSSSARESNDFLAVVF